MNTRIAIGLPTNRGVKPQTVLSLMEMVNHSKFDYHVLVSTKGYNTAENRNWIVAQAVKNNCTHLLLLDDDMVWEKDSIDKLLSHNKRIVGAKYSIRRVTDEHDEVIEYMDGEKVTDLFKCNALGGGLLLIKTEVFQNIKPPFFWYKILDIGAVSMSNDWWFCEKAREAGYNVWCDATLKPKHIGDYLY
jgi:hypothetical protein